jgi:hypothetical protein
MLDVRNAIAGILDRYTLADVVEVTLRKLRRRNGVPLPFSPEADSRGASRPRSRPPRPPTGAPCSLAATRCHRGRPAPAAPGDYTI